MIKAITIEDNEKYLRQISKPVDLNDKELEHDIQVLDEYCTESEKTLAEVLEMASNNMKTRYNRNDKRQ